MKKQLGRIVLALGLSLSFSAVAQNTKRCGTYEAMEQNFKNNPGLRKSYEEAEKKLMQFAAENPGGKQGATAAVEYTIPVVFHILHTYGPENVSDAECIAALAHVNRDFARQSQDTNSIVQPFKSLYVNSEIKFMLAHKDPNGNCTNGIVHHYDTRTVWDQSDLSYYAYTWNPTRYLNIYIVKQICQTLATCSGTSVIIGYTHKPGAVSNGASSDVIVYDSQALGVSFPDPAARDISHEIGHWLGLNHTFGQNNNPGGLCGDDGVLDTPPTKGQLGGCPSSTSGNSCAPATTVYAAGQTNAQNIMDYTQCQRNFTQGQTDVMRATMQSNINSRMQLTTSGNLAQTDVNGTGNCAPIADFISTNGAYTVCAGGTLQFKDYSYNATVSTYAWSADQGATGNTPSSQVCTFTFPTVGTTNVTVTTSNAFGSSSFVRTIEVRDGTALVVGPQMESFEGGLPAGWDIYNPNPGTPTWEHTFDAAYDGGASFMIRGDQMPGGQTDYLVTPVMDVASNPNAQFEFAIAYAQLTSTWGDQLKLQASKDCGGTWQDLGPLNAYTLQLNSGGVTGFAYTPVVPQEWKIFTLKNFAPWIGFTNSNHVMVRFAFIEHSIGKGNNLFLDAVNLFSGNTSTTSINQFTRKMYYSVQPNPSSGDATVRFTLGEQSQISLALKDVLGRDVMPVQNKLMDAGEQTLQINAGSTIPTGIYFVNLTVNGTLVTSKLIIE